MATVDSAVETPVDPDTRLSARILRFLGRTPIHIVLVLIAVFWLIPTTGLNVFNSSKKNWPIIASPAISIRRPLTLKMNATD